VTTDLETIVINEGTEIVETKFYCPAPGLDDLTFLLFSVTHEAEDPSGDPLELQSAGHTASSGKPLSEVSGVPFYPGNGLFHVSSKGRACSSELHQKGFFFKIAIFTKHCVYPGTDVTLAYHDSISVWAPRIPGIVFCQGIKHEEEMEGGKRTSRVSTAG
jgi:hypothetical protein